MHKASCYSIRRAEGRGGHEIGRGDEQILDLGGRSEVLSSRISDKAAGRSGYLSLPSNIPRPDLIIGTKVILAGERISVE